MGWQPGLPGLDAVLPGTGLPGQVVRTGDNQWLLGLGQAAHELLAWPAAHSLWRAPAVGSVRWSPSPGSWPRPEATRPHS